ncbi:MAG: hypothetical protein HFE90_10640 [Firmicutes bacterium]|nr:hypothetical protein [Bacillota bacterium]
MYKTIKTLCSLFLTLCVCLAMTACSMSPQNMPASPGNTNSVGTAEPDNSGTDDSSADKSSPSKPSKSSSSYKSSSSFSNSYGTSKTKCAHAGCNNYIASSGDTNCCTIHSRRCLNCKKYIDEDALYCMKCLSSAVDSATDSKNSGSYNSSGKSNSYGSKRSGSYGSSSSKGCQFVYSNGSTCGAPCSSGKTLCNKHMKELTEIYNSLTD